MAPPKLVPKLSIGLPVNNGEEFLPEVLDCFLARTFEDVEIIICDNASTDRTPRICRDYSERDPRARYIRNERNLGAVANFNRVFELSTTPLFKWAAHDDLVAAHCVKIAAHMLARKEARNAAQGTVWHRESQIPTRSGERR